MKLARFASASALSFLLGTFLLVTPVLIHAQDQRDEAKPSQPESRPEEKAKPEQDPRQGEAKPPEQSEDKPARGEDKPAKQEDKKQQEDKKSAQHAEHGGQSTGQAHNGTPGRRGGHIPDDKFRATFGRQHTFAMQHPTTNGGQPRFQYGGYWFALVDAWPEDWAYTDECYIDYIDGEYFLIDLARPGIRLAIFVVE